MAEIRRRTDESGLDALTMRAVAERLGVSAMTNYTYVPGKAELLDLMLDALWLAMPREAGPTVRSVADANRALYEAHPWAARVTTARPPLGPGLLAKYEHELGAFDSLGLSDVDMDAALTGTYDADRAYEFGLRRIIEGLEP